MRHSCKCSRIFLLDQDPVAFRPEACYSGGTNDQAQKAAHRARRKPLFGVDTVAVANGKAYVSYPDTSDALPDLRVVDLSNYAVKRLTMPGIPTGVDVIPVRRIYLPLVLRGDGL